MRGLSNSFDVVAALGKSAEYLGELKSRYGNLGFAAAAYNAGENGLERFLEVDWLPTETRNYVLAITAYSVEDWRDNPPKTLDLTLDKSKNFLDGCVALASTRQLREIDVIDEAEWAPWGVQLAAHFQKSVAQRLFVNAVKRLPAPIRSEKALLLRERNASFGRRIRYAARIGRDSQVEANALCATIRKKWWRLLGLQELIAILAGVSPSPAPICPALCGKQPSALRVLATASSIGVRGSSPSKSSNRLFGIRSGWRQR